MISAKFLQTLWFVTKSISLNKPTEGDSSVNPDEKSISTFSRTRMFPYYICWPVKNCNDRRWSYRFSKGNQ